MHDQGNYTTPVGQDTFVRPPAFQQHPAASSTPATSHYGPLAPVYQQGHPSFHLTPGATPYQHARPSVPHQGPPAPVTSGGLGSAQSYLPHHRPPHTSTQVSHSYPTSNQQTFLWSQNVHLPSPAAPLSGLSSYQLPSSQGHTLERGRSHKPPSHAPPLSMPPYPSGSSALMSDPFGSSVLPMREHSHQQMMMPVLPLPPPPPSSPPGVPPLPPPSPPSDTLSKRDGGRSLKGLLDGNNLTMECPLLVEHPKGRSVHEREVQFQHTEKSGIEVGSIDVVVADSATDSDMDMEDDITHPDEDKNNGLSINPNDENVSRSQEVQLKSLQYAGGHRLPEHALHGNSLIAEASAPKAESGDFEIISDRNIPAIIKITSEAEDLGMSVKGQTEHALYVSVEDSSCQHKNFSQPSVPVLYSETGNGKLSDQVVEGANPVKLLQDYASDNTSENEEEKRFTNGGYHSVNDRSMFSDAEKGHDSGSELRQETLTESNKHMLSNLLVESPKNVMQTDKFSNVNQTVKEFSNRNHRGQEPVRVHNVGRQPKDSRSYDDITGPEGANLLKTYVKSNSSKLNVDEFGRLVREGVSDSDTSESPHHVRRHARRTRKRSRSRSPQDRRRRRSPWRRKERRSRSRSLSPKRRRSRSRSPVLRRDSGLSGDKLKRGKGQLPECFDFLRGKCYRGASCRYSHHESDKSERSKYNRGKQHHRDAPPNLHSFDVNEESKVLPDNGMQDKGLRLTQDMTGSMELKDVKWLPADPGTDSLSKLDSLGSGSRLLADVVASNPSAYSTHGIPSGKDKSLVPESAVQYSGEIPQTVVYQQGKMTDETLASESFSLAQAIAATSTHCPADKPDTKHGPPSHLSSVDALITKPYSTEEVPSQSVKDSLPSLANCPSQLTFPSPPASQAMSAPFAQPIAQDYNLKPPISWNHIIPENDSPNQAPMAYQHSHFPGQSKSLSRSFLPLSPPPPPPPPPTGERSVSSQHMQQPLLPPPPPPPTGEQFISSQHMQQSLLPSPPPPPTGAHSISSQHMQQSLLPPPPPPPPTGAPSVSSQHMQHSPWNGLSSYTSMRVSTDLSNQSQSGQYQAYPSEREPDQMLHSAGRFGSSNLHVSNLTGQHGGPPIMGDDHVSGRQVQGRNPSLAQDQPNSLLMQLPMKGMHSSGPECLPSDSSYHFRPYLQQPSYGLKYSGAGCVVHPQHAESGTVSSSVSRITPDFLDRNRPYVHDYVESRTSNYLNSRVSSFDLPPNTKFSPNASIQENDTTINTKYASPVGLNTAITISVLPRPGGDQYDPLFDSIEPASNSFSKADHYKDETTGDSDDVLRIRGSERLLNMEGIKQEGGTAASANDFLENEECGETADVAVGAVLNETPSDPNDATDLNAEEIEIDQVKTSGKKKKSKERSAKLFKISIASFVKEVLKPSWRQGNMSKEAFKTIVKKTVDKVSGAMKSHQIPKSQAKINHYIDSSRGKLTKLVMGYVDKYVKV